MGWVGKHPIVSVHLKTKTVTTTVIRTSCIQTSQAAAIRIHLILEKEWIPVCKELIANLINKLEDS